MSENQVALITGASRGIGRAVAKDLACNGIQVIAISRTVKDLESLYDEIVAQGHITPFLYPFNLCSASLEDYDALRCAIEDKFGRLDFLIHCAGILGALSPIEHFNIQTWYQVLQVNLNAVFILTQSCMQLVKKSQQAKIIFTLSEQAVNPKANWGAYAVANAGCKTMAQMLQAECSHYTNIAISTVYPSKVRTSLRAAAYPAEDRNKLNDPEKIAEQYSLITHA